MKLVLRMIEEKAVILKATINATAWCDKAVDDLISGDAKSLRSWANFMTFKDDRPEYGEPMRVLYATFRKICLEAAEAMEAAQASILRDIRGDTSVN